MMNVRRASVSQLLIGLRETAESTLQTRASRSNHGLGSWAEFLVAKLSHGTFGTGPFDLPPVSVHGIDSSRIIP